MEEVKKIINNWPLHLLMLAVVCICEAINTKKIPVNFGSVNASILFLPMLFAMVFGLVLFLIKPLTCVGEQQSHDAGAFVTIGIAIFIAKVAVNSGAALDQVIKAGPALILQEFGNLGTIVLAMPFALLLGFGRESVGMTHSISREPNVGYIATKYGPESPEFRGVMVTYITGTLIGTIFMGLMATALAATGILHPYALGMACGVGSGSMMAASLGSLTAAFPDMAETITAYAGTSNVLSNADGMIMTVIMGVPMANWLYAKFHKEK